ncbi:MAG: hypothetical protein IJE11_01480 [Bacteroidales bacterium]|nr:hypothetical protein [Bacteroidales bacterium]
MKKIYSYISIIITASFFSSCVEENIESVDPSYREGEVVFSAVSGFETGGKDTKTVYSGDTYTVDGVTYERIEWEANDKIKIYCHTGNNKQAADYSVGAATTSSNHIHTAVLNKHDEDNGIHWNGTDEHRFYAIYPSPTMPNTSDSKTDLEGKVDITYDESTSTATLKGYVPTTQSPIEIVPDKAFNADGTTKRTADHWAKPDMRYSYMVASTTATPSTNGNSGVNLSFSAVATALEIEIVAPEETTISEVIIQSKSGAPLTGNFTCPIDQNGKPKTNEILVSEGASTVNIQLGSLNMKTDETLRLTALLLPVNVTAGDLNIIVQTDKLMRGNLGGVSLTAHKKHYLTNIVLKKSVDVQGNNWITVLPDDVLMRGLSIPASSNSFSYYLASGDIDKSFTGTLSTEQNRYVTQIKSFEDQWNMGVRCFEFVSDRNSNTGSSANIGGQDLRCNSTSLGIDFRTAFEKIVSKVSGSDEFAMVICTYQPEGVTGNPRNPEAYMTQLRNFYTEQKDEGVDLVLYQPGIDIDFVRGSIMLVARPSQEGEDSDTVVSSAVAGEGYNILTVKGWGSLPDKWWRRGYETMLFRGADSNGERKDIRAIVTTQNDDGTSTTLPAMESWIYGDSDYGQTTLTTPYVSGDRLTTDRPGKEKEQRYNYPTDVKDDNGNVFEVWAQEWRRVFKNNFDKSGTLKYIVLKYDYDYSFFSSLQEKKDDILHTFEKSINDISDGYVYFNSLSGYFVIEDLYQSYAPYWQGNVGDIGGCATAMNDYFDGVIEEKGEANITGPMGVVIMDRVGETQSSIDLARIIIANNFKFALPTSKKYPAGSAEVEDWVDESLN